ncbi:TIGR01777 family oxidoreductase [Nannocystis pusilla]|uniref:TIGR01777 family oxidoreductase n=1 Tax=Nannocystis pusilla TaxID=889268 RepID=A0A9X3ELC8_9BACT|nr:TIGR01777 family oxidoreductase [Nannocystis pusilla]MCY1006184.1 TIGR01777 family oxidoreductase [Nannocystis pusilla]
MHILVTGATGFVGRALVLRLLRDGHHVRAWVRSPRRAADLLGAEVELVAAGDEAALVRALTGCEAVIHLAGESVGVGRWTAARKRELWDSRVTLTETLVRAIARAEPRPKVLISASAVGYYGDRGDEELDETSRPADDFLGAMCQAWEAAAREAEAHGVRVCTPRLGLVLGHGGGVLGELLPIFRAGLGGPLGSGEQWFPWIHLHDLVELLTTAVTDARYSGPVLAVAPQPVTNLCFSQALAESLGRKARLPVPRLALRIVKGEAAGALVASQRAVPARTLALGFAFQFATLPAALDDLFGGRDRPHFAPAEMAPPSPYLARRSPTTVLRQSTVVAAPNAEVFAFFSHAENLGIMTPRAAVMQILTPRPLIVEAGRQIDYKLQVGPVRVGWTTEFELWEPDRRFIDVQTRGPFAAWWHEHRFAPREDGGTEMDDTVYFRAPLGPIGRIAEALFVRPRLREIFEYRAQAIRLRFGAHPADDGS